MRVAKDLSALFPESLAFWVTEFIVSLGCNFFGGFMRFDKFCFNLIPSRSDSSEIS